jgi:hypothetical protein
VYRSRVCTAPTNAMTSADRCITRRQFVHLSASIGAALAANFPAARPRSLSRAPFALRIGVINSKTSASRDERLGIELGVDEARHAAQLFGGSLETVAIAAPSASDRRLSALVGGGVGECLSWAAHAAEMRILYLNIACTDDALRSAHCSASMFHVVPSDAMYRDAIAIARGSRGDETAAWDSTLSRFGADTLNQRFRARFNRGMTSGAWAGWLSIKILWESALRQKSGDGSAIAEYLTRDGTQFDGHKGQPLSFRAWDHQLRQPLYVVSADAAGGRRVKEVPESSDGSLRDALDHLGVDRTTSSCAHAR